MSELVCLRCVLSSAFVRWRSCWWCGEERRLGRVRRPLVFLREAEGGLSVINVCKSKTRLADADL